MMKMTVHGAAEIATLYAQHQRGVLACLQRLVHDRETAEDLCQQTFLKALQAWHARDTRCSTVAWLYRIARNTAYDELRRRQRIAFTPIDDTDQLLADERAPEARLSDQEPLRRALAQLAPLYRWPLLLYCRDGYSVREIAAALGCPANTIKSRLYRARLHLKRAYRD